MVESDLLCIHDVSEKLKVPERTVRHWARTRVLPGFKVGKKKWGFRAADVERSEPRLGRFPAGGGEK